MESWHGRLDGNAATWATERVDQYLLLPDVETLGVKIREGQLQLKRFGGVVGKVSIGPESVPAEAWAKWSLPISQPEASEWLEPEQVWVEVSKTRRLVQLFGPAAEAGCDIELSRIKVHGAPFWSVCLEAFGPTAEERFDALNGAAVHLSSAAAFLPVSACIGYPAWLCQIVE